MGSNEERAFVEWYGIGIFLSFIVLQFWLEWMGMGIDYYMVLKYTHPDIGYFHEHGTLIWIDMLDKAIPMPEWLKRPAEAFLAE